MDSESGEMPNPIVNGRLIMLPIGGEIAGRRQYRNLRCAGIELGKLVCDLSKGRISPATPVHLDPDLSRGSCRRRRGWRPMFGQAKASEAHLARMGVTVGDLFLFFGWFRVRA